MSLQYLREDQRELMIVGVFVTCIFVRSVSSYCVVQILFISCWSSLRRQICVYIVSCVSAFDVQHNTDLRQSSRIEVLREGYQMHPNSRTAAAIAVGAWI